MFREKSIKIIIKMKKIIIRTQKSHQKLSLLQITKPIIYLIAVRPQFVKAKKDLFEQAGK